MSTFTKISHFPYLAQIVTYGRQVDGVDRRRHPTRPWICFKNAYSRRIRKHRYAINLEVAQPIGRILGRQKAETRRQQTDGGAFSMGQSGGGASE
ncbi:MAG: hypothetical protein VX904_04290 [Planctomycetota bacterium]|nr:hypothetical protein [Planctomycetota bacterium]